MVSEAAFLHVVISACCDLSLLLFAAKVMTEWVKLPVVLGELVARIIIGPFALGSPPLVNGEPLVILDETVKHIGGHNCCV